MVYSSGTGAVSRETSRLIPFNSADLHGREAIVIQRGGDGVFAHILRQRLVRFERADATAEVAAHRQRDEGGAVRAEARGQGSQSSGGSFSPRTPSSNACRASEAGFVFHPESVDWSCAPPGGEVTYVFTELMILAVVIHQRIFRQ